MKPFALNKVSWRAFTIVELLAVIAIILFLVGLLMPALSRIRETAKNVKCMHNLRQIVQTSFVYSADNDGFAPGGDVVVKMPLTSDPYFTPRSHDPAHPSYDKDYPKNKWFAEYFSDGTYGLMNPIGYCPKGGRLGEIGPNPVAAGVTYGNMSYGMNPDLWEDWWGPHDDKDVTPLGQVNNPATRAFWMDANRSKVYEKAVNMTGRHFSVDREISNGIGPVIGPYTIYRYLGRCNVGFIDGHVAPVSLPDEAPLWSCSFWRLESHHNQIRNNLCAPDKKCKLCDKRRSLGES
jgi:prepilin-type processing-associated H-X9-DG protein